MNLRIYGLPVLVFLSGCTSVEFVRKDLSPQKQAVLRYSPTSSPENEGKAREQVRQKATDFCEGQYQITKEFQAREESGTGVGVGTGVGFGRGALSVGSSSRNTQLYNFVEFTCDGSTPGGISRY